MNIKKLEKATRIYEQIKTLDAQIIEIDRFAMLVANGETLSIFELKVEDLTKKKEDAEKVSFDADGSLIRGAIDDLHKRMLTSLYIPTLWGGSSTEPKTDKQTLTCELSDNSTLQILGVLLCDKQAKRQVLLNQLEKLGVAA